jgi:hypothetical protein
MKVKLETGFSFSWAELAITGTAFVSDARAPNYTEAGLRTTLRLSDAFMGTSVELNRTIEGIFALYPDVPALGSPYGTGNELFGSTSLYKRAAAIRKSHLQNMRIGFLWRWGEGRKLMNSSIA